MRLADSLREAWEDRARVSAIEPVMTITGVALVLGAGTVLAKRSTDAEGRPSLAIDGNEEGILALLAVAYGRAVDPAVIDHIRRASCAYAQGETCLALIHLAHSGLAGLADEKAGAYRLFLASELFDDGVPPRDLLKACGFDTPLRVDKAGFNPGEPRVPAGSGRESGEWTDDGETPELIPAAARRPADQNRNGDPDEFFDTAYTRIHALAQRLGIDENWLLGLAAHASGYLKPHNRAINNLFGTTHGGGPDVHLRLRGAVAISQMGISRSAIWFCGRPTTAFCSGSK